MNEEVKKWITSKVAVRGPDEDFLMVDDFKNLVGAKVCEGLDMVSYQGKDVYGYRGRNPSQLKVLKIFPEAEIELVHIYNLDDGSITTDDFQQKDLMCNMAQSEVVWKPAKRSLAEMLRDARLSRISERSRAARVGFAVTVSMGFAH